MYQKFLAFKEELKKRYGKDIQMDYEDFVKFADMARPNRRTESRS